MPNVANSESESDGHQDIVFSLVVTATSEILLLLEVGCATQHNTPLARGCPLDPPVVTAHTVLKYADCVTTQCDNGIREATDRMLPSTP